jgi:hypothetical protein
LCRFKDFYCADLRIFTVQISDFLLFRFQDFGDIPNPAEQFGCGTLTGNSKLLFYRAQTSVKSNIKGTHPVMHPVLKVADSIPLKRRR